MNSNEDIQHAKFSDAFATRLHRLKPGQKIRVIVMLQTENSGILLSRTRARRDRTAVSASIRKSAQKTLPEIDGILERFNGKRLAMSPDALGCIPIETTAAGVIALAASEHVKAVLEDQQISLLT